MRAVIKGLDQELDLRDFPNDPREGDLLNLSIMILDNSRLRSALAGRMYKVKSVSWVKGDSEFYVEVAVKQV